MFFESPQTATALAVTTTAAAITALADPAFTGFTLAPTDGTIYYGDSTVSTTNGIPVYSGSVLTIATKNPAAWWVRAASTIDCRLCLYRGHR